MLYTQWFFLHEFLRNWGLSILMYKSQKIFQKKTAQNSQWDHKSENLIWDKLFREGEMCELCMRLQGLSCCLLDHDMAQGRCVLQSSLQPRLCLSAALREMSMEEVLTLPSLVAGNSLYWELLLFWSRAEVKINGTINPMKPLPPWAAPESHKECSSIIFLTASLGQPCHQPHWGWGHHHKCSACCDMASSLPGLLPGPCVAPRERGCGAAVFSWEHPSPS